MATQQPATQAIPKYFLYGESMRGVDPRFLHVESIASRSRLHNWTIRPHAHRELHHLLLVERGGGSLQAEAQTRPFGASSLISVPAVFVHGFSFSRDTDGWIVTVSSALLQRLITDNPELKPLLESRSLLLGRAMVRRLELPRLFQALVNEYREHALGRTAAIEAWLTVILVAIRRAVHETNEATALAPGSDSHLVARYQALLEAQFKTALGISEYATQLCVSPERLRKACARVAGASPLSMLADRRIVEAKRGLLYTGMHVAQIAYDCGFEDPAYFTRFFTRLTGHTPSAYRSQRRTEATLPPASAPRARQ